MLVGGRVPEVVEADLVQRGQRLERGDVAAELRGGLVGADDHRDRVPAHDRAQPALEGGVAGERRLAVGGDRVDIVGVEGGDRARAGVLGALDDARQQFARALGTVVGDDRVDCLQPFGGLDCVEIAGAVPIRAVRRGVVSHAGSNIPLCGGHTPSHFE